MYKINFDKPAHVYFMGIGGISMSGLAHILIERGFGMVESVSVLISREDVEKRIAEMAAELSSRYDSVHFVCILKGSVFFLAELAKDMTVPVTMDFISVSILSCIWCSRASSAACMFLPTGHSMFGFS